MRLLNMKHIALVMGLTLFTVGSVSANGSTDCPTVSSDYTVTSSCNTGITWTGGNLTIGDSESGSVSVFITGAPISGSGALGFLENYSGEITTLNNLESGRINVENSGISNDGGTITTLNNSGTISAGNIGISNDGGTITTLNNSGEIYARDGITNSGTIITLNNLGLGTISAENIGISNDGGTITTLNNSGTISAENIGINNRGAITTINNAGAISAINRGYGIFNVLGGTITTLTNSGTISAGDDGFGILNGGAITTLNNSDEISAGIGGGGINNNGGIIGTLTNSGTISAREFGYGIFNVLGGTITTLTNSGTISADNDGYGIYNVFGGTITALNNLESGTISAGDDGVGIDNTVGTIITLNNAGTISAGASGYGIDNTAGTITTLNNSGTISAGDSGIGIYNVFGGAIATLNNLESGTISARNSGVGIYNFEGSTITTLNNAGTISAGNKGYGIFNKLGGTITTLTNSGTISAEWKGDGIHNAGTITTLINSNSITGAIGAVGIENSGGGATITTLTNSGTISSGDGGTGIYNVNGTITTLNNLESGRISVGAGGAGIDNQGTITTLTNSGRILAGNEGYGISNTVGTIATLNNSGRILVGELGVGIFNLEDSIINTLTNSGTISAGAGGNGIHNANGTITTLNNNSGTISAGNNGYGIYNQGTITALNNNSGTISVGAGGYGIFNLENRAITTLTNAGTISAGVGGVGIFNEGNIETLTNSSTGTISAGIGGAGIVNDWIGTIVNLNNAQGGNGSSLSTTALTYRGKLPTNYKVIINSASQYGQLAVTSPVGSITNFGIYGTPFLTSRTYAGVLTNNVTVNTLQAKYDNMTLALVNNTSTGSYDLTFTGASLLGTQQSLVNTAAALQNTYALQNAVLTNSFSYDCPVFGEHNVCVSAGGRNTAVSNANGLNNTSALLIAAYRIKPTLRIGAYADQNLSVNNAGSTVNLGNSTPLIGLFGVWNQHIDGTGTEVKVAAAYGQKNTTVNRQIVGLSEPGTGSSNLNSQGAQITAKYGFAVAPEVLFSPYVGMRYTQNNMSGYTEGASSSVTDPLTYSALNTNATTVLAGVGASYRFIPKATLFASAGVETDTNTSNGTYSATGITGLTPVNFNPNPVKTRPTATLGAYYDIVKNQRIGITGIYRQESYQAISTTTVMATYTIGL